MVPQVIVAIMAPWVGRRAGTWAADRCRSSDFAALPIRALVFAWTTNPIILIAAQLLDGVSGTMLGVLATLIVANLTPYWPVQPSAGLRRDDIRSWFRSARYFQVSWPGALAARLDFWHRRNSGGSRASRVVADA